MDKMFSIDAWYFVFPAFLIYIIILFLNVKKKNKGYTILQYITVISFGVYVLSVIALTIFPIDVNTGIYANQAPWYKLINFIPILTIDLSTFVLNIIMCIPLGVYLALFYKDNSLAEIVRKSFLFSLSIEIIQFILQITVSNGRCADINDLLANTLGGALGYLIINSIIRNQNFENLISKFKLYQVSERL